MIGKTVVQYSYRMAKSVVLVVHSLYMDFGKRMVWCNLRIEKWMAQCSWNIE